MLEWSWCYPGPNHRCRACGGWSCWPQWGTSSCCWEPCRCASQGRQCSCTAPAQSRAPPCPPLHGCLVMQMTRSALLFPSLAHLMSTARSITRPFTVSSLPPRVKRQLLHELVLPQGGQGDVSPALHQGQDSQAHGLHCLQGPNQAPFSNGWPTVHTSPQSRAP